MAIKRIFSTRQAEIRQVIRPQGHSLSIFSLSYRTFASLWLEVSITLQWEMLFAKQVDFACTYTDLANLLY